MCERDCASDTVNGYTGIVECLEVALATARHDIDGLQGALQLQEQRRAAPIPMLLWCPECEARHIDEGEFATKEHHTHACQSCGMVWRPAIVPTVGVGFLPGFKNEQKPIG